MLVSSLDFFTVGDAISEFGGYYKSISIPLAFLVSLITLAKVKKYYTQKVMQNYPSLTQAQALSKLQK